MARKTFKQIEQEGWASRAAAYDDWLAAVTRQAIEPILHALGDLDGKALLDICTGTGHLAGTAATRGAAVEGVDFAATMVERARANYPAVAFHEGDAEALAFPDASFDLAVNGFGLWHLADPDASLCEAFRVLRPGGRFAFSTWLRPEDGFDLFAIVTAAVRAHDTSDQQLLPAPPPFRFADPAEAARSLRAAGFDSTGCTREMALWHARSGAQVLELIEKSLVRAPMMIRLQSDEAQARIRAEIVERAEAFRIRDRIELRFPYLIHAGTKR